MTTEVPHLDGLKADLTATRLDILEESIFECSIESEEVKMRGSRRRR
jgi:hypothetical protein